MIRLSLVASYDVTISGELGLSHFTMYTSTASAPDPSSKDGRRREEEWVMINLEVWLEYRQ